MILKYKFATGEVTEVEVSEEIGTVILDLPKTEMNSIGCFQTVRREKSTSSSPIPFKELPGTPLTF